MTNTRRRQLQRLMESTDWDAFLEFHNEFMLQNFAQQSIRRNSEFDTIWYAAESEGGRKFLQFFISQLEEEAKQATSNE